jgi:uncharacterized membrane protein YhaH (DUF805 family)
MSNLISPKGRTRRREYIIVNLIYTIVNIPIYFSIRYLTPATDHIYIGDIVYLFFYLISFFPLMIIVTIGDSAQTGPVIPRESVPLIPQ